MMALRLPPTAASISLAGVPVDLLEFDDAVELIAHRSRDDAPHPLAVVSINLDHIHYFGTERPLGDGFGLRFGPVASVDWLNLVDGAPLAAQARRLTAHDWPRLAGSDLIGALLQRAEHDGASVGFLGGSPQTHELLASRLARTYPGLIVSGHWAPPRELLADAESSCELARSIAAAKTDVLIVSMGKPRQELWIDHYGDLTHAHVLLAFGAVVDFLAGSVGRAPRAFSDHGLEWLWRLALEPRRLARRYLIDGPPAYVAVRHTRANPRRSAE